MTSPYIVPTMLKNLSPLGIDWDSIPISGATDQQNMAALLDICYIASDAIDTECFQPIRCTCDVEELVGPGGDRLTVNPYKWLNAPTTFKTQHWPVVAALGGQYAPAAQIPPTWNSLTASQLWVSQQSNQFLGGSSLGSSGGDGMNEIHIQPGLVGWQARGGYRVQIAYENGWPMAGIMPAVTATATFTIYDDTVTVDTTGIEEGAPVTCLDFLPIGTTVLSVGSGTITVSQPATATGTASLQVGYAAGVTVLNVDDVTGMAGTRPTIFDSYSSEGTTVASAAATSPVAVLPGLLAEIGPGTVTLASPTRMPHTGSEPALAILSAVPSNVRLAGYYYAGAEAMQRGGTAFVAPALPGSLQSSGGTPSIGDLTAQAEEQLKIFRRIF